PSMIRQKRQSSGSADPLLGHRGAAYADECTDRRVDEPRRVVVAVAAAGAVHEDEVVTPDLLAPAAQARLTAECAQPGAALLLHLGRNGVGGGGRRARARRVGEDVDG